MKILFFIDGPTPSPADRAAASALGTEMFRNAQAASGIASCTSMDAFFP